MQKTKRKFNQDQMPVLADKIKAELPEGWGLTLITFPYMEPGKPNLWHYISTAQKDLMIKGMVELAQLMKRERQEQQLKAILDANEETVAEILPKWIELQIMECPSVKEAEKFGKWLEVMLEDTPHIDVVFGGSLSEYMEGQASEAEGLAIEHCISMMNKLLKMDESGRFKEAVKSWLTVVKIL